MKAEVGKGLQGVRHGHEQALGFLVSKSLPRMKRTASFQLEKLIDLILQQGHSHTQLHDAVERTILPAVEGIHSSLLIAHVLLDSLGFVYKQH